MKILLKILLVLQIISAVIVFFATMTSSIILSILTLFGAILEIALTVAVIYCLDNIEDLSSDFYYLQRKVKELENGIDPIKAAHHTPAVNHSEESKKTWKCIKCETVNKAGTTHCEKCGAEYSSIVNPTYDSNPEKMSRFLKEKKKRI